MSERGFFSRILGGDANEDETRVFSAEEVGTVRSEGREEPDEVEQRPQGFTVERAAEVIDDLPPDVPRESALRIVRGTLTAAGIKVEDLERSTRVRESKLNSEMAVARDRQEEIRRGTEEVVRSLEAEIRKAREDRDTGISQEEDRISRASMGIEGIKRVRTFFGFPEPEEKEVAGPAEDSPVDETRVLKPFDEDETQVLRRPDSPGDADSPAENATASENPSLYRDRYGPTARR
ncbi:MAG: hypothetical protein M3151_11880 [Actinomycetota bacterium]|nr:hypothetical protein [Actinomycetota bacterium]